MVCDSDISVSVIIPTFNRCRILKRVLNAFARQTFDKNRFEVIVIDDGSTDATRNSVLKLMGQAPFVLRYYYQSNKKQGAARNNGISRATMPLLLFVGDDIIPKDDFIESHVFFYQKLENPRKSAVIGYTTWSPEIRVTPFMAYIGEYGDQFGYSLIQGKGPLPFNFYYASNLLIPSQLLTPAGCRFDEGFNEYGWEDIELGYRLENAGVALYYNSHAVAGHHHPVDVSSFCRRQKRVGYSSSLFVSKHPQLRGFLGERDCLQKKAAFYPGAVLCGKIAHVMDKYFSIPLPRQLYRFILDSHYAKAAINSGS